MFLESVMNCDVNIKGQMYSNIVLCGGNSMIPGIRERMHREVEDQCGNWYRTIADPQRFNAAWIGGSIIGSLSIFKDIWISKQDYDECGPNIVHRKCFM